MSDHTPGPWVARFTPIKDWWIGQPDARDGSFLDRVATVWREIPDEAAEANAHLIAAAPELLEALEGIVDRFSMLCDRHALGNDDRADIAALSAANDALAKAKGAS